MRTQLKRIALVSIVYCFTRLAIGHEAEIPVWANQQNVGPISWPPEFFGHATDEMDEPIEDAKISLVIKVQIWTMGGIYEKTMYESTSTTDAQGRYSFSTERIPQLTHRPISVEISAAAKDRVPWRTWWWYGTQDEKGVAKFGTVRLRQGNLLQGTCVNSEGAPVANAVLRGFYSGTHQGGWGEPNTTCDDQGRFSILIPTDGQVAFWAYADDFGPNFFKVDDAAQQNVKFRLDRGAKVFGLARSIDGAPLDNAIVKAESFYSGDLRSYSLPFKIAVRTDALGRFRFPPITGKYRIYLTSASENMMDGGSYESVEKVPLSIPRTVNLKDGNRQNLIIRPSKTAFISGTVNWNNQSPAAASVVRISQMPKGNGSGLSMGRVVTDANGSYKIEIPTPIERLVVYVESRRRNGVNVRAMQVGSDNVEFVSFDSVNDDQTLNFRYESPGDKSP